MRKIKVLDLFSGIGGFSLAAEWVFGDRVETVAFCEIDPYCQEVLKKNYPDVEIFDDIEKLDGYKFKNIDMVVGGFPCQDISTANYKGEGINGKRSGLWSEMCRIIGEVRPKVAFVENVPNISIRGGVRVVGDLTEIGYDSEWITLGANQVGAWHKRNRFWLVSYPNGSLETDGRKCKTPKKKSSK
jgi:DNA (cytosine-5)-methyltransferase 1